MLKVYIILCLFGTIKGQCSNFWKYVNEGSEVTGRISLRPNPLADHRLKVNLALGAKLISRYQGDISLYSDTKSALTDYYNGQPLFYRVRFPIPDPLPKITAIFYNNQVVCQESVDSNLLTITLEYDFIAGIQPTRVTTTAPPFISPTKGFYSSDRDEVVNKNEARRRLQTINSQCGVPFHRAAEFTGLVINGMPAKKGQFPWLVSFFYNGYTESGFICGATLVSHSVVITAAHCIQNKGDPTMRHPSESLFYLGKLYQPEISEQNYIISGASKFILHPDWNYRVSNFDADLAAVVLIRKIQFTEFIRPICIWSQTSSFHDIINQNGVIAGWGKVHHSATSSKKPFFTIVPVIDEQTCLRSNNAFSRLLSKRTFCVGNRDGSGPCSGDSGGCFAIKRNDRYYLRGIISSALYDRDLFSCDTKNYAIMTDTSAYIPWIVEKIERYG